MLMYVDTYISGQSFMFVKENCTPLYFAARQGHSEVVKLLLQSNADVNCVCKVS